MLGIALLALFACSKEQSITDLPSVTNDVRTVTLSRTTLSLIIGRAETLSAQVAPWNAREKTVTWSSSAPEIASVNDAGMVTALAEGEADIIAACGGKQGVCHVVCSELFIPAEGFAVTLPSRSLLIGTKTALEVALTPENTTERPVWTSSDETVATVAGGVIDALAPGYATVKGQLGDMTWEAEILVHDHLWLEQVDPLLKPVADTEFDFCRDTVRVARGETATFQFLVYSDTEQDAIVPEVTKFAAPGGDGWLLAPKLWWVRDVRTTEQWYSWCGGTPPDCYSHSLYNIPDPLMPLSDYEAWLQRNRHTALWVEFDIPRDFAPGLYEGEVKVSSRGEATLPFVVQVYDVTLPERQGLDVLQWQNYAEIETMTGDGSSPDMYQSLNTYMPIIIDFMNDYGQNGWRLMYASHYSYVYTSARKRDDGKWEPVITFDEAAYKREFDLFYNHCKDLRQIQGHNLVAARGEGTLTVAGFELDDAGDIVVDESNNPKIVWVDFPTEPERYRCVVARLKAYFDGLRTMLQSHSFPDGRKWWDVYMQTVSDEPGDDNAKAYNDLVACVKQAAPDFPILEPIQSALVDLSQVDYPCLDQWTSEKIHAPEGQRQWMYCAMGPQGNWANRFIRIPLLKTRILHWLNYSYDTWGFLHWGLNYWVGAQYKDPWRDAGGTYPAGDMWIIWPGDHKVYPSIRLHAMRDGIRDFDLLRMIEKRSKADADAFCARLIVDRGAPLYDMDVQHFRQLRKDMLEYLSQ